MIYEDLPKYLQHMPLCASLNMGYVRDKPVEPGLTGNYLGF